MPTPKPRPSTNQSSTPSRPDSGSPSSARPATSRSSSTSSASRGSASTGASSRPKTARPTGERTVDLSASAPKSRSQSATRPASRSAHSNDPGVKRRAAKKAQALRKNVVVWSVFVIASVILSGMTLGVWQGKGRYLDSKQRLANKQATLRDLQAQLETATRRLAAVSSDAGKHRTLVENGFLRDGERLLLFPMEKPQDKR